MIILNRRIEELDMEKIINEIYSNNNFPIILFSLIGIFIVLFIITLILALRDARRNTREIIEEESIDNDKKITIEEEKKEQSKEDNNIIEDEKPIVFEDINFNDDIKEEKVDILEKKEEPSNDIIFTDIDEVKNKEDILNETTDVIPILNNDEISNFEEFFLENLKDEKDKKEEEKDDDIFDFSSNDIELPKRKDE